VKFSLDEEQDIPGVSVECSKDSTGSGAVQCQDKKPKNATPQCERSSASERDLTLPVSEKTRPKE
jgi:hypothetical protein